jgi:hypothetical protein
VIEKYGERGRNRTFNLLIKSQLLCQLSYAPGLDVRAYSRRSVGACLPDLASTAFPLPGKVHDEQAFILN